MTNKLALAVAVILGILSILGIKAYVERIQLEGSYKVEKINVMVAARNIDEGQTFTEDDIEIQQFPREFLEAAFRNSWIKETERSAIVGGRTKAKIKLGQVLQTIHFYEQKQKNDLQFTKSERAVTIPIDPIGGLSGMLRPGSNVDLIVSLNLKDPTGQGIDVTRTLFKNVRIIATDGNTDPFGLGGGVYASLTFALPPGDCNKLVWCVNNGATFHCLLTQPGTPETKGFDPVVSDQLYREIAPELRGR